MREEIRAKFFEEHGYKKYKCKVCGEYFWSRIPRERCPDRPCSKYDFLTREYGGMRSLSLDEARSKFIDFFKRNNHGYVDPYPVLARWRNDLYLTIASIIVFQPMVTEGLVDPPYNPLVIVQPCIRLEDIDNVGLTFGRHLTSFEMGGHHAFNKDNNQVYWIDETLRYSYEFFTEEIGVPPDNLVYKESWWEGGGNAGPAFEVLVDGLEVATLVFMKYKVHEGKLEENPVLVVDTGYGIERIAWLTQRKPTSFHVIYGGLIEKYKDILGVEEPPHEVLREIAYHLSDRDIAGHGHLRKAMDAIGYGEYYDSVRRSLQLYTLLDHTRTILLMLSDGIVPSNVGEGYLARLVIRRALKTLLLLGIDSSKLEHIMKKFLELQAGYWRNRYVYGKFHKHLDYALDVVGIETRRFNDAVQRGLRIAEKTIRRKKHLEVKDLVRIYDSQGIPPEIVADIASKYNVRVDVPPDFYSKIAEEHGGSGRLVKEKAIGLPEEVVRWATGYGGTRRLFHENPYMRVFTARILGVKDNYVVLDRTAFYPKGGGQDYDTGYLEVAGNRIRVKAAYKAGSTIIHLVENADGRLRPGETVRGIIDWGRRYVHMRHHTATHIVLAAARSILGDHVWQAGAEKTTEKARLDITHHKSLSMEELRRIEREANRIIDEHIQLQFHMLPRYEAERKYGLRIYQGGAILEPVLRIVEIPGVDAQACFGTHVYNTAEVGGVKIISAEKIQDGVVRLEYVAATRIPQYAGRLEDLILEAKRILGEEHGSITVIAQKTRKNMDNLRRLVEEYRAAFMDEIARQPPKTLCGIPLLIIEKKINDPMLYRNIMEKYSRNKEYIVILYDNRLLEIAMNPRLAKEKDVDLKRIVDLAVKHGGKGGGKRDHVTIRIDNPQKLLDEITGYLERNICDHKNYNP